MAARRDRCAREILEDRTRQDRDVPRRRHLLVIRKSIGVDVVRSGHAEPLGRRVHTLDKSCLAAGDTFGKHHRDVIGRFDDQRLERQIHGHLRADRRTNLARRLVQRVLRAGDLIGKGKLAVAKRLEGDVGGHQLGQRGRMPELVRILGVDHEPGFRFDDESRTRVCGNRQETHQQSRNGSARTTLRDHGQSGSLRWQEACRLATAQPDIPQADRRSA